MATKTTTKPKATKAAAKKPHAADAADRAKIAAAGSFAIHFRVSPTKKIDRTAATLAEARAIAAELNDQYGKHGRRAGVFAIPRGKGAAVLVPDSYEPPAAPAATQQRLTAAYRAIYEAALAGKLPPPPDFSANTHAPYRKKLAALIELVKAKDVPGLAAFPINPVSTSPKALDRFRNWSAIALTVQAAAQATSDEIQE